MALTVHHLQRSQSERIIWLCEELGVPYELKLYQRAPLMSPPELKALSPLGTAPVVTEGNVKIAESAACAEWIIFKHGNGRLAVPPSDAAYADYLFWWHFSNGTLQPTVSRKLFISFLKLPADHPIQQMSDGRTDGVLQLVEDRLGKATYLAGDEFTAADVMSVFSLTTMRVFVPLDLSSYPNILAWLERVSKREAYQKAMAKGDPDFEYAITAKGPPLLAAIAGR